MANKCNHEKDQQLDKNGYFGKCLQCGKYWELYLDSKYGTSLRYVWELSDTNQAILMKLREKQ